LKQKSALIRKIRGKSQRGRDRTEEKENVQPAFAEGFGVAGAHLSRRSESEGGAFNAQSSNI
jgi:hypothetical protein